MAVTATVQHETYVLYCDGCGHEVHATIRSVNGRRRAVRSTIRQAMLVHEQTCGSSLLNFLRSDAL